MIAHQLDANGVIINTIVVPGLDFLPGLIDASIGGKMGDRIVNGALITAPAPKSDVPMQVSRLQGRQALFLAGLLDKVQPAIDAIVDPVQRGMMQIEWADAQTFDRDRPSMLRLGTMLGLDDAGLDALFIKAGGL